ncbi:hypothetical protein Dsin_016469 [Dipteronia sinensis]|uniref:RRM domain-containing protein n=1 Tax=Dipteronia sinensis TaxID=43782 RepID=A0AAE0E6Z9_9ROSI|nr:hypothetical protein Dsin_016469 [Dipteronia sinensis]
MDNINPKTDLGSLSRFFKPFRWERDVFLSSKNNSRRKCFAFVHFALMEEASQVVERTDGMVINGWKIRSKIAKYDWSCRRSVHDKEELGEEKDLTSGRGDFWADLLQMWSKGFQQRSLFSSCFLGDIKVLRMFESEQKCSSFIRNRFYEDDVFTTVENLDFSDIAKSRLAWVNVLGVPLNCWNEAIFFKLGEIIGKPVLVGKTKEKTGQR